MLPPLTGNQTIDALIYGGIFFVAMLALMAGGGSSGDGGEW